MIIRWGLVYMHECKVLASFRIRQIKVIERSQSYFKFWNKYLPERLWSRNIHDEILLIRQQKQQLRWRIAGFSIRPLMVKSRTRARICGMDSYSCCYSYKNTISFNLGKEKATNYGVLSSWLSEFKFGFGRFSSFAECIRNLFHGSREWRRTSWLGLRQQQLRWFRGLWRC